MCSSLDKAIELAPKDKVSYLTRADIYDNQGKKDLALADYTKAIQIDPNDSHTYALRGAIYATQGNYGLAIADFTKAKELDANSVDAYIWRGNAFADTQLFSQAIADYQKAISLIKDNNWAASYVYCVEGITYTKMGDFKSAIQALEEGVKNDLIGEHPWCKVALENARQGIPTP